MEVLTNTVLRLIFLWRWLKCLHFRSGPDRFVLSRVWHLKYVYLEFNVRGEHGIVAGCATIWRSGHTCHGVTRWAMSWDTKQWGEMNSWGKRLSSPEALGWMEPLTLVLQLWQYWHYLVEEDLRLSDLSLSPKKETVERDSEPFESGFPSVSIWVKLGLKS